MRIGSRPIVATARATQASVLLGVPTMYQALLTATTGAGGPRPGAAGAGRQPDYGSGGAGMGTPEGRPVLSGLRLAVCGSAPLNPALAERLRLVQQAPTAHREPEPVRPPRKAGQSKLPES